MNKFKFLQKILVVSSTFCTISFLSANPTEKLIQAVFLDARSAGPASGEKKLDPLLLAQEALHEGANPNCALFHMENGEISRCSRPLLNIAVQICSLPMIALLLEYGADQNERATLDGEVPLHKTVEAGRPEVVALLISKNAIVDEENFWGETPLYRVAQSIYDPTTSEQFAEICLLILDKSPLHGLEDHSISYYCLWDKESQTITNPFIRFLIILVYGNESTEFANAWGLTDKLRQEIVQGNLKLSLEGSKRLMRLCTERLPLRSTKRDHAGYLHPLPEKPHVKGIYSFLCKQCTLLAEELQQCPSDKPHSLVVLCFRVIQTNPLVPCEWTAQDPKKIWLNNIQQKLIPTILAKQPQATATTPISNSALENLEQKMQALELDSPAPQAPTPQSKEPFC